MPKHILIADDDPHIREVVVFALEKAGMRVSQAADGKETLERFAALKPDLLVLDISMPEMDGLEVCRQLRRTNTTPILFLSSRDDEIDRVIGLEIGGDDYVTKPFSPRELVARVNAILRRGTAAPAAETPRPQLTQGRVMLDTASYTAMIGAETVPLTATEFMLLLALFRQPGRVFTRDELMDQAYDGITVSDRTIDSHIRRIRAKFAAAGLADVIATNHGIGYKLGNCQ